MARLQYALKGFEPPRPLPPHALDFPITKTDFLGFAQSSLANFGEATDGFDALFSEVTASYSAAGPIVERLASTLGAVSDVMPGVGALDAASIALDLAENLPSIASDLDALDTLESGVTDLTSGTYSCAEGLLAGAFGTGAVAGPGTIAGTLAGEQGVTAGVGIAGAVGLIPGSVVSILTGTVIPVVGAFILFNELFNLNFGSMLEAYQLQFAEWMATDPLAASLYACQQQLTNYQAQLASFPAGQSARQQLETVIARKQAQCASLVQQIRAAGKVPQPPKGGG